MVTKRLGVEDRELARRTFVVMAEVFGEGSGPLGDAYLDRLLAREDFFAYAALDGGEPIGGLTAHALMMTRSEDVELFLYDIAVREDRQRRGVGRALVAALRAEGEAAGMHTVFVPADVEDEHALDFYRALGGDPADVTIFTWTRRTPGG